jgi:hypothetical protein
MTRAFCNLVLHYSIARLSWKTIKSLRRPRKSYSPPRTNDDDIDCVDDIDDVDGVSPVEYEILQGWTILAFHHLYIECGIEYAVRCIVPFYYHIKMMLLFSTFVVQTRPMGFGGGMSPFVAYWFDYVVVPCVHRVHTFVGGDPRKWATLQLAMLPFTLVDYFVFPGLLTPEDGIRSARDRLRGTMAVVVAPPPIAFAVVPPPGGRSSSTIDVVPMISSDDDEAASFGTKTTIATPQRKGGSTGTIPDEVPRDSLPPPLSSRTTTIANGPILTPLVRRRLASTASKLRKFSPDYRPCGGGYGALPRLDKSSPERVGDLDNDENDDDDDDDDVPRAKFFGRRIIGSPPVSGAADGGETRSSSFATTRRRRDDDGGGRRRGQRLSLGDHFRELVTGDANVRVRDHLFDLDLPSTPERRKGRVSSGRGKVNTDERGGVDARHVTTRRSSRIAGKKIF